MNKQAFLDALRQGLSGFPQADIDERLSFYSEMIDDRTEDGLTEEEAVAQIGPVADIIAQTLAETPLTRLVREKVKPRRAFRVWEIVLLVLGSPLWLSLLIAAVAVVMVVYVALWAVIIALWAVEVALFAGCLGCIAAAVIALFRGQALASLIPFGAGCVCGGLAVFFVFVCKGATKSILVFTKKMALWIKRRFVKKEAV